MFDPDNFLTRVSRCCHVSLRVLFDEMYELRRGFAAAEFMDGATEYTTVRYKPGEPQFERVNSVGIFPGDSDQAQRAAALDGWRYGDLYDAIPLWVDDPCRLRSRMPWQPPVAVFGETLRIKGKDSVMIPIFPSLGSLPIVLGLGEYERFRRDADFLLVQL